MFKVINEEILHVNNQQGVSHCLYPITGKSWLDKRNWHPYSAYPALDTGLRSQR